MTFAVSCCICSLTSGTATPGSQPPNDLKAAQQRAIERAEEPRHALHVEDVHELIDRSRAGVAAAKRLIGELHQRHLVVRRLQHAIELRLLPPLRGVCNSVARSWSSRSEFNRLVDQDRVNIHAHGAQCTSLRVAAEAGSRAEL